MRQKHNIYLVTNSNRAARAMAPAVFAYYDNTNMGTAQTTILFSILYSFKMSMSDL